MNKELGEGGRGAYHGLGGRKAERLLRKLRRRRWIAENKKQKKRRKKDDGQKG